MKSKFLINSGVMQFVLAVLGMTLFNSCLKDNGPVQDFSQSPALVSFQFTGNSAEPLITSVLPGTSDSVGIEVTLSASSVYLGKAVIVTIAPYQAGLDSFNTANSTSYTLLPSAAYTIPTGGNLTISAGQQIVPFVVHVNESLIDFSTNPALAFRITNAQGATIATNLNVIILPLTLRNFYEGNYTVTGYFVHPASPRAINATKALTTISATRSEGQVGDLGGNLFDFDVNGSNMLVNWAAAGATSPASGFINGTDNATGDPNYPGPPFVHTTYNNTYDPVNRIFWMHYGYNGSNPAFSREIYEKWVRQ
jgi:hypothetical protein